MHACLMSWDKRTCVHAKAGKITYRCVHIICYVCMYVCMYVYIYIYIYIYIDTHTHTYIHTHTHTCLTKSHTLRLVHVDVHTRLGICMCMIRVNMHIFSREHRMLTSYNASSYTFTTYASNSAQRQAHTKQCTA
jgi:hypothetical protein